HQRGHPPQRGLLLSGNLLVPELGRDIAGDPERADDLPPLIPQRHLGAQRPASRPAPVGFPLQLPDDRLAGADDLLLILAGGEGMLVAEDIEIRLPGQRLSRSLKYTRSSVAASRLFMQMSFSSSGR